MKKESKNNGYVLQKVEFTPKDKVTGKEVVKKDGTKFVKTYFHIPLTILGKKYEFNVFPASEIERQVLLDMFGIKKTDQLPVRFVKTRLVDKDSGEITEFTKAVCCFDEKDDIHTVELKPMDQDKKMWQMAIKEAASGYKASEEVVNYRKERYEAVKAREDKKKEKQEKKVKEDLPF